MRRTSEIHSRGTAGAFRSGDVLTWRLSYAVAARRVGSGESHEEGNAEDVGVMAVAVETDAARSDERRGV